MTAIERPTVGNVKRASELLKRFDDGKEPFPRFKKGCVMYLILDCREEDEEFVFSYLERRGCSLAGVGVMKHDGASCFAVVIESWC